MMKITQRSASKIPHVDLSVPVFLSVSQLFSLAASLSLLLYVCLSLSRSLSVCLLTVGDQGNATGLSHEPAGYAPLSLHVLLLYTSWA